MLQCLYSQCQTSQFGSALHHTLKVCSSTHPNVLEIEPPLIRHQNLRKRGTILTGIHSGYISASTVHSKARRSVSASAYQTLSARAQNVSHRPSTATKIALLPAVPTVPVSASSGNIHLAPISASIKAS